MYIRWIGCKDSRYLFVGTVDRLCGLTVLDTVKHSETTQGVLRIRK